MIYVKIKNLQGNYLTYNNKLIQLKDNELKVFEDFCINHPIFINSHINRTDKCIFGEFKTNKNDIQDYNFITPKEFNLLIEKEYE